MMDLSNMMQIYCIYLKDDGYRDVISKLMEATGDNNMGVSTWQPKDSHFNKLQIKKRVRRD